MSQPTPHVAEKELCELRDHMKGCKSCPVGVPCVIAFNIRLKISEKEIQRLTREVEILEPCVRHYAQGDTWMSTNEGLVLNDRYADDREFQITLDTLLLKRFVEGGESVREEARYENSPIGQMHRAFHYELCRLRERLREAK